jgi:hypothetical protein
MCKNIGGELCCNSMIYYDHTIPMIFSVNLSAFTFSLEGSSLVVFAGKIFCVLLHLTVTWASGCFLPQFYTSVACFWKIALSLICIYIMRLSVT